MSYGNPYIEDDIRKLQRQGKGKTVIVTTLSKRIKQRYPDMSMAQCKRIVAKLYEGKKTTMKDWTPELRRYKNPFK